jgi:hypothetical protein
MIEDERQAVALLKAKGLRDVDGVRELLKQRRLKRSRSAIHRHVRRGVLVPAGADDLRVLLPVELEHAVSGRTPRLFTSPAIEEYVAWLTDEGRDGRLLRYARVAFRADWHYARHKDTKEMGALGAHRSQVDDAEGRIAPRVEALRAKGYGWRTIGRELGVNWQALRRWWLARPPTIG